MTMSCEMSELDEGGGGGGGYFSENYRSVFEIFYLTYI